MIYQFQVVMRQQDLCYNNCYGYYTISLIDIRKRMFCGV